MKQSYSKILLLFAIIQICHNLSAHDFVVDGIYYNKLSDKTVEVTYRGNDYGSYKGSVSIPEAVQYNGVSYSVTEIGSNAFTSCTGLTSVTIPNSVTEIGSNAFSSCTGLTSVTIPNSVTEIGRGAFFKCSGLKSVIIPNSVKTLGSDVFFGGNLHSLTLGTGLTRIGENTP